MALLKDDNYVHFLHLAPIAFLLIFLIFFFFHIVFFSILKLVNSLVLPNLYTHYLRSLILQNYSLSIILTSSQ